MSEEIKDQPSNVIPVDIAELMKDNYIDYSMSVIVGRALPDVRDGLKPVHRRVLYAMNDLGTTFNKPYKKCARIVGEVLGKYHPHGDTSVYGTIVRMAQTWSLNHPLIDGQGNFGSPDGETEAAMRYTECRLDKLSDYMFKEIKQDTIGWQLNFDDSLEEPTVLPVMFPQLLVNGSSGIAVGMATNILPHNLVEVINATIALIDNPHLEDTEFISILPAPDFPTGGVLAGLDGARNGILTGKGSVLLRGHYEIEEGRNGKVQVIIKSVPYTVSRDALTEKIGDLIKEGKLPGVSDVNNESSGREGTRITLEIKRDHTPEVVMNHVYKHTNLQLSFAANNTVLVDGRPVVLSARGIINEWIKFRYSVTKKRLEFDIKEYRKRLEILDGYMVVMADVDTAIEIIKGSKTAADAKDALIEKFSINENQAKHVLDLRLAKLTSMELDGIRAEHKETVDAIASLETVLGSDELIFNDIKDILVEIRDKFGVSRRSQLSYDDNEADMEEFIEKKDTIITLSHHGYVKRTSVDSYRVQARGGSGKLVAKTKEDDYITDVFFANTHSFMFVFTDRGFGYYVKAYTIPEGERATKGRSVSNFIMLQSGEKIIAVDTADTFENKYVLLCTKKGVVKKMKLDILIFARKKGVVAIVIEEGDSLVGAVIVEEHDTVLLSDSVGRTLRVHQSAFRTMGRKTIGNYGIDTEEDVVSMVVCKSDTQFLISISQKGLGKKTPISQYRIMDRNYKGLQTIKCTDRTGPLFGTVIAKEEDDLMITCKSGKAVRIAVSDIRQLSRNTQGVTLISFEEDTDEIVGFAAIHNSVDEPEPLA